MPKAYVLCDIEVTDPDAYQRYRELSDVALAAHDGRFVVRGGAAELLEGDGRPNRVVVLEFPDAETARRWYRSPEYSAARAARRDAARARLVLVEGC